MSVKIVLDTSVFEFDAEMRFRAMAMRGSQELGLSWLDKLDALSPPQAS